MTGRSIITPWSFRDGKDYIITFVVNGHPSSLCLKVADKITAEEWTCSYNDKSIESLTHRTGSFKSFDIFTSMLKSAILKKSDSVALDLMTIQDLEALLSQKKQTSSNYEHTSAASSATHLSYTEEEKSQCSSLKKRFLIMTYVSEFDTVRYPIPLNYAGPPDPVILQNNIKRLHTEVSTLRNAKEALEEEVNLLRLTQPLPRNFSEGSISKNSCMNDPNEEVSGNAVSNFTHHNQRLCQMNQDPNSLRNSKNSNNNSNQEDEIVEQRLVEHIKNLEDKFLAQKRDHHHDKMKIAELEAENAFLRRKLEEFEAQETDLHAEVHRLSKEISCIKENELSREQAHRPSYKSRALRNPRGIPNRNGRSSNYFEYESDMDIKSKRYKSCDTYSRKHRPIRDFKTESSTKDFMPTHRRYNRSPSPADGVHRPVAFHMPVNSRSRSNSSSRQPKFDPTAYVTEKKMKQDKIAQMRLERVNSRLSIRSNSSDARSRSNSMGSSQSIRNSARINVPTNHKSKNNRGLQDHANDRLGSKFRQTNKPMTKPVRTGSKIDITSSKTIHNAGDTIDDTQISDLMSSLDPLVPEMHHKKGIQLGKGTSSRLRSSLNPPLTLKPTKIGSNNKAFISTKGRSTVTKQPGIRQNISRDPIRKKPALDRDIRLDPVTITALNCLFNPISRQKTA